MPWPTGRSQRSTLHVGPCLLPFFLRSDHLLCTANARLADPEALRDSSVSTSHLPLSMWSTLTTSTETHLALRRFWDSEDRSHSWPGKPVFTKQSPQETNSSLVLLLSVRYLTCFQFWKKLEDRFLYECKFSCPYGKYTNFGCNNRQVSSSLRKFYTVVWCNHIISHSLKQIMWLSTALLAHKHFMISISFWFSFPYKARVEFHFDIICTFQMLRQHKSFGLFLTSPILYWCML